VVDNSKEALEKWAKAGVDKVIACCGTVAILNMEYESHDGKRVAEQISRAVCELKKICDGLQMKQTRKGACTSDTEEHNQHYKQHRQRPMTQ